MIKEWIVLAHTLLILLKADARLPNELSAQLLILGLYKYGYNRSQKQIRNLIELLNKSTKSHDPKPRKTKMAGKK